MQRQLIYLCTALILAATPLLGAHKKTIDLPNDNPVAKLKPGPGVKVVTNNCSICHSTDYIVRQPKFDKEQWRAEVKKMITVFGAPVSESDAKVIGDYISSNYGAGPEQEKK